MDTTAHATVMAHFNVGRISGTPVTIAQKVSIPFISGMKIYTGTIDYMKIVSIVSGMSLMVPVHQ